MTIASLIFMKRLFWNEHLWLNFFPSVMSFCITKRYELIICHILVKKYDRIPFMYLFIYLLLYWGMNSGPSPWATLLALFCDGYFLYRVLWTICLDWLRTLILLVSAFWVARIIGVSHQHPVYLFIFPSSLLGYIHSTWVIYCDNSK
jgi:hypothetical protein